MSVICRKSIFPLSPLVSALILHRRPKTRRNTVEHRSGFMEIETVNADTSKSAKFDEFSIVDEHLSEPEATLEVSSHEPDITIAQPYKGVEVKERSRIFYTADTFVLDDHDLIDSFVLEVPNELRTLKEGMHAALPKVIDASFVVDISKGEDIT
ncbi:hypothetical protein Scep_016317 [Stephania cephalantha]|uniref:Uncharacterized protein n=1 Tax=Stephania cephalantha TaxID=152367 RepID=A0AAP0NU28_9MAGN